MDIPGTLNVDVSLSESLNFSQLKPNKSRLINNLQKIIQTVVSSEISILKNIG